MTTYTTPTTRTETPTAVTIQLIGQAWMITGSYFLLFADNAEKLVQVCNNQNLFVTNKDAVTSHYANQLNN